MFTFLQKPFYTLMALFVCIASHAQPSLTGKLVYHHYSNYSAWDAEMFILDFSTGLVTNISSGWDIDHEMNGVFSPDGTKIVFMGDDGGNPRNWDIYLWTVGGGDPVNLTNGGGRDEDPKFSPDGTKIVYKSAGDIYVMDLNGNVLGNLTNSSVEESMPYYTSDGSQIVFMENVGSSANISIMDADGSNRSVVADNVNIHDYYPIVRDASSFFYTSWVSSTSTYDQLRLKYFGGSDISLPFNTSTADYSDAAPVGSDYVVLSSTKSGGKGGYDLYIANINTGQIWSLDSYNSSVNSTMEDLGGCYFAGSPSNQSPSVGITSPSSGASYTAPASITIQATASDSDGSIDYVDFYEGANYLGTDTSSPYSYTWSGVSAGSYSLTAEAFDNNGASTTSSAVSVAVTESSSCEYSIPLLIQAEDYCDMSGVVLEPCSDTGGGQDVGGINTGDWMEYVVNVPTSGNYEITYRIATTESGAEATAYQDGVQLTATALPATGGWQIWESVTDQVSLSAGVHTLKIENTGLPWNINWLDVASVPNQAPSASITSPTTGASYSELATITIQATASDSDGSIDYVDFYEGANYLGTDTSSPYSYTWSGVSAGSYSLTAEAFDNNGASTTSSAVSVTVNAASGCTTYSIPTLIQAEDYCDMSGVVLEPCSDTGGGQDVGGINVGDWMEYEINVPSTATYTITYRIASPNQNSKITAYSDGSGLGSTTLPNTGGWQNWQSVNSQVSLTAGIHTLRIENTRRSFNINWLQFTTGSGSRAALEVESSEIVENAIYPNPASDKILINLKGQEQIDVKIYTLSGALIKQSKIENGTLLNISSLEKGIYLISLNEGMHQQKLIVK